MTTIRTTRFIVTAPGQTNTLLAGVCGAAGYSTGTAVVDIGHDIRAIGTAGTPVRWADY